MRRLMLLRHAKSDWSKPGQSDHERGLAARGKAAAPLMGRYMASHALVPDHAIVSTAVRTRETWSWVEEAFPKKPPTTYEQRIYHADPATIVAAIAQAPAAVHSLLVVGHNPGFHDTALLLTGSGDRKTRAHMARKFPTAALAVIDFDIADWAAITTGGGHLDRFVTPRALGGEDD